MHHRINAKKLNRTSSHRKAMLANMANSLIMHEQIKTTVPKAKALKRYVEKLITLGKKGNLAAKRRFLSKQHDLIAMRKIFAVIANRYEKRNGGYTRIMKSGFRYGDMAPMAIIELVDRDKQAKGKNYGSKDYDVLTSQQEEKTSNKQSKKKTEAQEKVKDTEEKETKETKEATKVKKEKKTKKEKDSLKTSKED